MQLLQHNTNALQSHVSYCLYLPKVQGDLEEPREKCYKCMRVASSCICKHTNPIYTNTRFVILMHPKEHRKEKNGTGRMTNLQLENSEMKKMDSPSWKTYHQNCLDHLQVHWVKLLLQVL